MDQVVLLGVALCERAHQVPFEAFALEVGYDTRPARCPECRARWVKLTFPNKEAE